MAKYSEGDAIGEGLEVINPDAGRDEKRRRYVEVRCVRSGCTCGGRRWTVREDKLRSGKTVSCGRVSKDNYKRWLAFNVVHRTDLDAIDPDLVAMADADRRNLVDAVTGEIVAEDVRWKDRPPETKPQPQAATVATARATEVKPEPSTEDKLREAIPYLDIGPPIENYAPFGFVKTFGRVPRQLRIIDGKPLREHLESAGLINSNLALTEKGKDWLAISP